MRQGNSNIMTQEKLLNSSHRANKPVNDQCNDGVGSTSGQRSSKNSRRKSAKMQQANRKIQQQSNKSAIGKASTSSKAKVPSLSNREWSNREKIGPSQRSTVGNQNDRVGAAVDDRTSDTDTDMTIITQQNNASLRDSIPSDVVDSSKNASDTDDRATQRAEVDDTNSIDFRAVEKNATVIDTDLQDDGAASGIIPTNENNNNCLTANKDSDQVHPQESNEENHAAIANNIGENLEAPSTPAKKESRVKPLPQTDDPIARLNALRANISNALKEVKAVLDQHAPEQSLSTEDNANDAGADDCVKFRFVKRIRKKSIIKFDDEEIVCNAPSEGFTESSKLISENDTPKVEQSDVPKSEDNKLTEITSSISKSVDKGEDVNTQIGFTQEVVSKDLKKATTPCEEDLESKVTSKIVEANILDLGIQKEKTPDQMMPPVEQGVQENAAKLKQNHEKPPSSTKSSPKKEPKTLEKSLIKRAGKSDNPEKKPSKVEAEKLTKEPIPPKDFNKKSSKSNSESKIPIAKKPIQTINNKQNALSKETTELVTISEKNEKQPEKITGQISNKQTIVKESEGKMTDEKLDQKAPENLLKDINERVKQNEQTKAEFNKNLNIVTKLDNIESVEQVIKIEKQLNETSGSQKQTPVRIPVQKFANVEIAAKELLSQARKNKQLSRSNSSENSKKLEDRTDHSQKVGNDTENVTTVTHGKGPGDKQQQSTSLAVEVVAVKKSAGNIETVPSIVTPKLEKEVFTKPPVKLKNKRGSLTESSRLKVNTTQLKRASIGSESELIQRGRVEKLKEPSKDSSLTTSTSEIPSVTSKEIKTSASSILKPISESAPANKVPTSTAPIKAVETNTSNCAQSETFAKNNTTMKVSPSLVESKSESLAEITQTPGNNVNATITQPIPIESNDVDAKIATVLSQNVIDLGKPLTSSPDKLVSSESAGLSCKNTVTGSAPKMTVVKKDIVPSITPKKSLDELNEQVKNTETINEDFDSSLVDLPKLSAEQTVQFEPLVKISDGPPPIKVEIPITHNGEVNTNEVSKDSSVLKAPITFEDQPAEPLNLMSPQSQVNTQYPEDGLPPHGKISPAKKALPQRSKLWKLQKQNSISDDSSEKLSSEQSTQSSASEDDTGKEGPKTSATISKISSEKPDNDLSPSSELSLPTSMSIDGTSSEENAPKDLLTSTATESSLSESEKDPTKAPATKKMRKMKKVVIRRIKRRLSKEGSQDEKAEPEVCEKAIAEPEHSSEAATAVEEAPVEPVEEEPPVPKAPKSCLVKRCYSPGQIVMYADYVKKNVVKWKKAVVLDKITDHSYKLAFDGQEKPAHIGYIKKFTEKKVQFGGKEYLEIDYQQEYESSSEEEEYNIWARV